MPAPKVNAEQIEAGNARRERLAEANPSWRRYSRPGEIDQTGVWVVVMVGHNAIIVDVLGNTYLKRDQLKVAGMRYSGSWTAYTNDDAEAVSLANRVAEVTGA